MKDSPTRDGTLGYRCLGSGEGGHGGGPGHTAGQGTREGESTCSVGAEPTAGAALGDTRRPFSPVCKLESKNKNPRDVTEEM